MGGLPGSIQPSQHLYSRERTLFKGQPLETDSGELTFVIQGAPASLQAAAPRKELVRALIKEQMRTRDFLLSGDVKVEIEWMLNERHRYESHVLLQLQRASRVLSPILNVLNPNVGNCPPFRLSCQRRRGSALSCCFTAVTMSP